VSFKKIISIHVCRLSKKLPMMDLAPALVALWEYFNLSQGLPQFNTFHKCQMQVLSN